MPAPARRPASRVWHALGAAYRSAVVRGRWVVLAAWAVLGVIVYTQLPVGHAVGGDQGFSNLLPAGSPALQVEERSLAKFRVPVLSGTTVVVHQPGGLAFTTRARVAKAAYAATRPTLKRGPATDPGHVVAAVPVPLVSSDTAVTYLFLSPGTTIWQTSTLANRYARGLAGPGVEVRVTGFVPAQVAQAEQLAKALPTFELASVVVIALIIALTFRSVLAPVAVLIAGGTGYALFYRTLGATVGLFGLSVPQQLEPVLAALFLGVITDYCVLFFSSFRAGIAGGLDRFAAARESLRLDAPVVAVAGTTVAGGIIALLVSPFAFFRSLGPALAATVVAAMIVSLTLTPALMALLGARLFSLRGAKRVHGPRAAGAGHRLAVGGLRAITTRPGAALTVLGVVGLLLFAAAPVLHARLSLSFTAGLPAADPVSQGARILSDAGIRGITAPIEVLVEDAGITARRAELARLQAALEQVPGVVRVIGPAQNPADVGIGVVLSADGDAARYVVILDSDPLGARAVHEFRALQADLPGLAAEAGLPGARVDLTGQTRIASEVAGLTVASLRDTLILALLIELVILIAYLRSVLAPLAVLLSGLTSMGAALGLTVLLFQDRLGQPGLTFYAPFSTAVLLLALGSDYTVFTVGAIWREARRRPLREAIVAAVPASARAVTAAGVILASTFALVGLVPLTAFRQIAFTMTVGLLIDTLLVRPLLTPALLALLGRAAQWPRAQASLGSSPPAPSSQPIP